MKRLCTRKRGIDSSPFSAPVIVYVGTLRLFQKVASFERARHSFPPEAVENSGVMATNPDYKAEKGTRRAARLPVRPTRRRTPQISLTRTPLFLRARLFTDPRTAPGPPRREMRGVPALVPEPGG